MDSKKQESLVDTLFLDPNEIIIKEEPESYLIQRIVSSSDEKTWAQEIKTLFDDCTAANVKSIYGIGYRQDMSDILNGIFDNYRIFYELLDQKPSRIEYTVKPAAPYLIAYHTGAYHKIGATYEKMLAFADEQNLLLGSYWYEDAILDCLSVTSEDKALTKISRPIL